MEIVDFYELASILKTNPKTLHKRWREFPHFFTGTGHNLKTARFIVSKVVEHLENVSMVGQKQALVGRKDRTSEAGIQKGRIQNEDRRGGMGGRRKKEVEEPASTEASTSEDPFNLLQYIRK